MGRKRGCSSGRAGLYLLIHRSRLARQPTPSAPGVEPVYHCGVDRGQEALGADAEGVAHGGAGEGDVQVFDDLCSGKGGRAFSSRRAAERAQRRRSRVQHLQHAICPGSASRLSAPSHALPPTRWMKMRQQLSLVSGTPCMRCRRRWHAKEGFRPDLSPSRPHRLMQSHACLHTCACSQAAHPRTWALASPRMALMISSRSSGVNRSGTSPLDSRSLR